MTSGNGSGANGGVSDLAYDIITLLQSKLEAISIYDQFIEDAQDAGDTQTAQLFQQIEQQDRQHVELLASALERLVKQGNLR